MKKNLMKKVFAVTLSVAMACSIIPATNPVTASAAASVKLKASTSKTLTVGQKSKLTLKNNTKKWKVVKATSSAKKVVKVYKTANKYAKVKGKSEGKAVITVKVKSAQTNKTKKLKMTFNVKDNTTPTPTPDPTPDPTPVQTDATVKNQEELDAALADSNITKITVATEDEAKFVIKEGSYSAVDLTVNAPKADVENSATFKSITINAIKDETWVEKAKGNAIKLLAKLARIIVDKDASLSKLEILTTDSEIKLTVNGEVANLAISAKTALTIDGDSKAPIKTEVGSAAKGTKVDTKVPVDVAASADMDLNLQEGAEGSKLTFAAADINVAVDNKTKEAVQITKFDKTTDKVNAGQKKTVTSPSKGGNTTTNPVYPGSGSSTNKFAASDKPILTDAKIATGASITVTSGGSGVISGGSLTFTVQGITNTSGSAMECSAMITSDAGMRRYIPWVTYNSDQTAAFKTAASKKEDAKVVGSATFTVNDLDSCNGTIKIDLSVRIKETATTLASASESTSLKITMDPLADFTEKDTVYTYRTEAEAVEANALPYAKYAGGKSYKYDEGKWVEKK